MGRRRHQRYTPPAAAQQPAEAESAAVLVDTPPPAAAPDHVTIIDAEVIETVDAVPVSPRPRPASIPLQAEMPVGEQLYRARVARDENIGAIASYLRIKPEYLMAFEAGQHENLPALTYALGFLRSYADYLGLDGNALREAFRREMAGKMPPMLTPPPPLPEAKVPPLPIMAGALLLALGICSLWYFTGRDSRNAILAPEAPLLNAETSGSGTNEVLRAGAIPPAPPLRQAPPREPTDGPVEQHFGELEKPARLLVKAEREAWITVTDAQDAVLFSHMLNSGDVYHVPDKPGLKLTAANADSLALVLDGKTLPKLGRQGQVLRDIALEPNALETR